MSLPPGFLDELRTRTSLAQVVGRKVTWDARKSNPGKGDYWAPCPFHQEKTASFHLDDRKGFYYCFGCHAKGDALSFIRETENVGFMEAVEMLAREAGLTMPARDPQAQVKADRATELAAVMEQAARFYRLQLNTAQGSAARDYLAGRGLDEAAGERFGIGYAPDSRTALTRALGEAGLASDLIVEAGLAIRPDDGGTPYDRFRGRIIFPIRDVRGRCIAFGGRAMDPNARAKYLNSPETLLFDKGRSLYNIGPAREAAGKVGGLIVAEGYMDVIALVRAGFEHAVAPLGTAITEDQLHLMWRLAPEPVIALDGDKAGLRAAMRLVDIALPLLEPGRSLRFCLLPEGMDPDDLLRARGIGAMQALLDAARPMVDLLWQKTIEGRVFDSPERRAGLDADLKAALATIRDGSIRGHYAEALRERRAALFAPLRGPDRPFRGGGFRPIIPVAATEGTRNSLLARDTGADSTDQLREAMILALCLSYPALVAKFESALERLILCGAGYDRLRTAILSHAPVAGGNAGSLQRAITEAIGPAVLENLHALRHLKVSPLLARRVDEDMAARALAEELAKLETVRGARSEISEAMVDMTGLVDEGLTWRLQQAAEAKNRALRTTLPEGGTEAEDRESLSAFLQNLIDDQVWVKKKG
ncbi:MAG: DNA primase [Rhodobacteraceae bacterium]|nr:DNA primase [Paracoccaceae bacterium]